MSASLLRSLHVESQWTQNAFSFLSYLIPFPASVSSPHGAASEGGAHRGGVLLIGGRAGGLAVEGPSSTSSPHLPLVLHPLLRSVSAVFSEAFRWCFTLSSVRWVLFFWSFLLKILSSVTWFCAYQVILTDLKPREFQIFGLLILNMAIFSVYTRQLKNWFCYFHTCQFPYLGMAFFL